MFVGFFSVSTDIDLAIYSHTQFTRYVHLALFYGRSTFYDAGPALEQRLVFTVCYQVLWLEAIWAHALANCSWPFVDLRVVMRSVSHYDQSRGVYSVPSCTRDSSLTLSVRGQL